MDVSGERYAASVGGSVVQIIAGTNAGDAVRIASGDALPGFPAGSNASGATVHIDPSGRVTFEASGGLWQGSSAADLRAIILTRQSVPGTADTLSFMHNTAMNDLGETAFVGDLALNGSADGSAMLAYDPASGVQVIARTGDSVQIAPGDVRTIASFVQPGVPDAPALGNDGTLLFRVDFTDGSSGLVTASVPEPAAAIVMLAAIFCPRRRRP